MRNIIVVTTSRSDYGILYRLLKEIDNDVELNLKLLVSGTHLSSNFGNTISEIEQDGFINAVKLDILQQTSLEGRSQAMIMSETIKKFANYFNVNNYLCCECCFWFEV